MTDLYAPPDTQTAPVASGAQRLWPPSRPVAVALAGAVIGIAAAVFFLANSSGDGVKESFASLQNLETRVSLQRGGAGEFTDASSNINVSQGDVVRTDDTGKAELNYFDGSLTRLASNTLFRVVELTEKAGARAVVTRLDVGRSWHRVRELTTTGDRFEVQTSNAVAAVRGTVFMVDCISGRCTFTVIEGVVEVTADDGTKILLRAGERVTVTEDGRMGPRETVSLEELRATDPWVEFNILRDQGGQRHQAFRALRHLDDEGRCDHDDLARSWWFRQRRADGPRQHPNDPRRCGWTGHHHPTSGRGFAGSTQCRVWRGDATSGSRRRR